MADNRMFDHGETPMDVEKYLRDHEVSEDNIAVAMPGLWRVEFATQRILKEASPYRIPKKGDIFADKSDLQPMDEVLPTAEEDDSEEAVWL